MKKQTPKLPKEFKKKWVAALRSGEYKQGKHWLQTKNDNSYCCLGVACRVAGVKNSLQRSTISPQLAKEYPEIPQLLVGDMGKNPIVKKLTSFNDGESYFDSDEKKGKLRISRSFKWIASYIERYL